MSDAVLSAPKYPIESVDNVLRLLLMLSRQKQVRVSEVSAELGTAVSTAHRLLAMLSHHGFVVQDVDSKAYRAGPVLLRVGLSAVHNLDIRSAVHPFAEKLRDETRETVHVAVLQGPEVMFIDCVESPQALRVASRIGTTMWAHCTSVGKVLLARESDDAVRALYPAAKLPAITRQSNTSRSALLKELGQVRANGYAHNEGESEVGVGSVSAAILDRRGKPVAGLSVSVPLARMPDERWEELTAAVRRVAADAEKALP